MLGAFAKGAPVRAIANSMTGADDLFWYVPAASPIKTLKDAAGKTIAYSTTGSSSNWAVLAFIREFGVQVKPVATGSPASTFTQTMSGQVDIGWSSPPFGVEALQQGRIRIVVARKRRAGFSQPDRPPDDHQHRDRRAAARGRSSATCRPIAKRWTGCIPIPRR